MSEHEQWEQLAAGYALDALEPAEEAEFVAHLDGCARCAEVLADHALVAAELGTLVDAHDAPAWDRIRPAGIKIPLAHPHTPRRRAPLWLTAAAAAVVLTGGAAVLLSTGPAASTQRQALAACATSSTCHVVTLQHVASLVVDGSQARLLPTQLHPAPAGKVYVLWQLPRDGRPTLVATLDPTPDGKVGEAHTLPLPYDSSAAFGISLEPASTVPTQPTVVIAVGAA